MLNLINIDKPVLVNGTEYPNSQAAYEALKDYDGQIQVIIGSTPETPAQKVTQVNNTVDKPQDTQEWRVHVKKWMTEKSSPGFDFMEKLNNDVPMPMVIMRGYILEETKGMYRMKLRAVPEPSTHCFRCGRALKHPVSVLYGIGPECGGHFHINPLKDKAELDAAMADIKQKMESVTWTGWITKSALKEMRWATPNAD